MIFVTSRCASLKHYFLIKPKYGLWGTSESLHYWLSSQHKLTLMHLNKNINRWYSETVVTFLGLSSFQVDINLKNLHPWQTSGHMPLLACTPVKATLMLNNYVSSRRHLYINLCFSLRSTFALRLYLRWWEYFLMNFLYVFSFLKY